MLGAPCASFLFVDEKFVGMTGVLNSTHSNHFRKEADNDEFIQ